MTRMESSVDNLTSGFSLARARFTSLSTSQETGATWLYQGQRVFSEWQLMQA